MNSQYKKGVLELLVLNQLAVKDCYGYELIQHISEHIQITEGTIYPLLRKLAKEDLVHTYLKESDSGPPRKYYQLSQAGFRRLEDQRTEWESFVWNVQQLLAQPIRTPKEE